MNIVGMDTLEGRLTGLDSSTEAQWRAMGYLYAKILKGGEASRWVESSLGINL